MFKLLLLINIILAPKDHLEFEELYLDEEIKLLENFSEEGLENYYDEVEDKFFGWSSYVITDSELI